MRMRPSTRRETDGLPSGEAADQRCGAGGEPFTRRLTSERGIALLLVLWVIVMLTVIATEYTHARRLDSMATRNFMEDAQSYYLARAGLSLTAAEILRLSRCVYRQPETKVLIGCTEGSGDASGALVAQDQETTQSGQNDLLEAPPSLLSELQMPQGKKLDDGAVRVVLIDAESRLNLNFASRRQLERLLRFSGVTNNELRNTIVDSILDWRDRDRARRLNGAEDEYYKGLPEPYEAKNGRFDTVGELLLVKCVSQQILFGGRGATQDGPRRSFTDCPESDEEEQYQGVAHYFTVTGRGRVNINTAPLIVLQAVGMPESLAQQIITGRPHRRFPRQARRYRNLTTQSTGYRVVAEGFIPGSATVRRVQAVVDRGQRRRSGQITVRAWDDNYLQPLHPPEPAGVDEEEADAGDAGEAR